MALLIASPWIVLQIGIAVLAPDEEISEMPTCETTSGNCAHLGGGDDYRLLETYATSLNKSSSKLSSSSCSAIPKRVKISSSSLTS